MHYKKCAYLLQAPTVHLKHFCFSYSLYNDKSVTAHTLLTDYHSMCYLSIKILNYQCRHLK